MAPSESNKHLEGHWRKEQDLEPDSYQNVRDPEPWFQRLKTMRITAPCSLEQKMGWRYLTKQMKFIRLQN